MKNKKMLALALAAVMVFCLLPASALADEGSEAPQEITNEKDGTIFNSGDTVFNNGGVVYNNAGIVYNNGGVVYNNAGTVYNNAGVVYNNGGTVYDNGGTVYNNDGQVFSNGGEVHSGASDGEIAINTAGDYSAYADFDGVSEGADGFVPDENGVCTITPKEGFSIAEITASAGELTENKDGSYTLSRLDMSALLTVSFKLDAPELSVKSGTYGSEQKLEISAAQGAEVFYTLDGSEPTGESEKYKSAITVDASMGIRAVAMLEGVEQSDISDGAYCLPQLSSPIFKTQSEGYKQPKAQGLVVANDGAVDAVIESVALGGENAEAFILNSTDGAVIAAGDTDESTWTIRPAEGLAKGAYSAKITVSFDSGDSSVLFVSFKVS